MRRRYYIHIYSDTIPNAYRLYYINDPDDVRFLPRGARITTRDSAEKLARQERYRRNHGRPTAGNADPAVFPASYTGDREKIGMDDRYQLKDWIWLPEQSERQESE